MTPHLKTFAVRYSLTDAVNATFRVIFFYFWTENTSLEKSCFSKFRSELKLCKKWQRNKHYNSSIISIIAHLVYPNDTAASRALLLLTPARQVNTIFWDCDGISPPYFSLNSSGLSWRAPFNCPTADERVQYCNYIMRLYTEAYMDEDIH